MKATFIVDMLIYATTFFSVMLLFFIFYVGYNESKYVEMSLAEMFKSTLKGVLAEIDEKDNDSINWSYVSELGVKLKREHAHIENRVKKNNRNIYIIAGSIVFILVTTTVGLTIYFYLHPEYNLSIKRVLLTFAIVLASVVGAKVLFYAYLTKHYHPVNKTEIDVIFIDRVKRYVQGKDIDDIIALADLKNLQRSPQMSPTLPTLPT